LANIHEVGHGVPINIWRAMELYMSSAEKGCARSLWSLGLIYSRGNQGTFFAIKLLLILEFSKRNKTGIDKNLEKGKNYFKAAADLGDCVAQNELAEVFRESGSQEDLKKAFNLFKSSLKFFFSVSQFSPKFLLLSTLGAKSGYAWAQTRLAVKKCFFLFVFIFNFSELFLLVEYVRTWFGSGNITRKSNNMVQKVC